MMSAKQTWESLKDIFREKLAERQTRNPQYSLRSFARDLNYSPAFVSQILSGKRTVSPKLCHVFSAVLKLNSIESRLLRVIVQRDCLDDGDTKAKAHLDEEVLRCNNLRRFDEQPIGGFDILKKWQNLAILNLTFCEDFDPDPEVLANRLGIQRDEAAESLAELLHAKLLHYEDGRMRKSTEFDLFVQPSSSAVVRNFHKAMIKKSLVAIDCQSRAERMICGTTVALSSEQVAKLQDNIQSFVEEITASASQKDAQMLYQLTIQMFRLDRG
jgi:uncharacterized protein (TIGR02147 family)